MYAGSAQTDRVYVDRETVSRGKGFYLFLRRAQDIFFSAIAIIVLAPLMLLTALAIVIDSKGSPIFSQTRCGKDGVPFKFYKFRTMCVDAEAKLEALLQDNEMDGPAFKMENDPRITRVGRFLRKTSLDELPQLWNILKGDMSICGPRPCLPREIELYNDYQKQRLYIKPGLTCYWQIQPDRNSVAFDEWVAMDIKYMQERSFLVDWKIIFQTVFSVLNMEGK